MKDIFFILHCEILIQMCPAFWLDNFKF
jgi:hypothetical protein